MKLYRVAIAVVVLAICAQAQAEKAKRPRVDGEIVAQEVVLSGTTTLNSTQLSEISNVLSSVTMHDSDDEVEERIKWEFMQRGYFDAQVTGLKVVALDPLAKKKPVKIEAQVSEGPLFHLAELRFKGNEAFRSAELQNMFPIHPSDVFNAAQIQSGLEAVRKEYAGRGFLNAAPIPDTQKSSAATITVTIDMNEGVQFRMGTLKIEGPKDVASNLASQWELKSGEPYNLDYLDGFLTKNRELLPETFKSDRDASMVMDCPASRVDVTLWLDDKQPRTLAPADKPCEKKDQDKDGSKRTGS